MAIIQCKFCELETTDYGGACHICGEPINQKSSMGVYITATLAIAAMVASCNTYFENEIRQSQSAQKESVIIPK